MTKINKGDIVKFINIVLNNQQLLADYIQDISILLEEPIDTSDIVGVIG